MDTAQPQQTPSHPATQAKQRLQELISQLREDAHRVTDGRSQAVFETSAEVLTGLLKQFSNLEGHLRAFPEQPGSQKLHGDKGDHQ